MSDRDFLELLYILSEEDFQKYGCPYCGCNEAIFSPYGQSPRALIGECSLCRKIFGVMNLPVHPREGTPFSELPDIHPSPGGEHFQSRGIGYDVGECFVCRKKQRSLEAQNNYMNNIAAFVRTKAAGERVVKMFGFGAWLDYRPRTPNWIQVKIYACDEHLPNLEHLHKCVRDKIITEEKVKEARGFHKD